MSRTVKAYDVVVVGGGAAGLSAGLVLARAGRSVVVVDAGAPRNAPAAAVHGFLTRDGISPQELLRIGRSEVVSYGGEVLDGEAVTAQTTAEGFAVTLADASELRTRRLIVTTGLVDELPDVPGLRERWGRDVVHCPYCHGYEVRGQGLGVISSGAHGVRHAQLFRQWSEDVTLFTHTGALPSEEETEQLAARGIRVVTGQVAEVVVSDDAINGVRMTDGTVLARDAVVVATQMMARSGLLESLGLTTTTHPMGMGEYVASDESGLTAVPGVWVAGNVTDLAAQVVKAAADAAFTAAMVNHDLITDDIRLAVEDYRTSPELRAQDHALTHDVTLTNDTLTSGSRS